MRTNDFLAHHGVATNPFAEEDAQTDQVFKVRCVDVRHPAWDKVYGDPSDPATSLVFGEKGAGKTAMRLQIADTVEKHNASAAEGQRVWVVEYDDFNPLLDHFADRLSARKQRDPARVLAEWKLWDHMDGILSLAVTDLVDHLLGVRPPRGPAANRLSGAAPHRMLDASQKRDLLLLAACYDNSSAEPHSERWGRLRRLLRAPRWRALGWFALGLAITVAIVGTIAATQQWGVVRSPLPYIAIAAGWAPWAWKWLVRNVRAMRVAGNVRVLRRETGVTRDLLMAFTSRELENQPLPERRQTDDRYELLGKLQSVLRSMGVSGLVVLVDRVDEPHLTGGRVEHMRDFIWSMLDNKFLKQPGLGLKLLLPAELMEHLNREGRDFHQRARLDKQNVIPSLDWTGEALGDLANARLAACAVAGTSPTLRELIDPAVGDRRIIDALRSLRTPRHVFRFLFRMITTHCGAHADSAPVWRVAPETFEAVLAVYAREQASIDRGLSAS
ncbi:MAG: hypothetical protein ACRCT8_13325 [Lacipirellulaceae bacterium]